MGDFAQMGLGAAYWPSDYIISLLEFLHVSTGLPWWASIAILTVMLRTAIFPIILKTTRNSALVPYFLEEQKDLMQKAKEARESNQLIKMKKTMADTMDLYRQWGYNPLINLLALVQIPVFIAVFRALWRCSNLPVPGWQMGGTAWFHDLTAIDPYFVLPIISGVTTAITVLVRGPLICMTNFRWSTKNLIWNQKDILPCSWDYLPS